MFVDPNKVVCADISTEHSNKLAASSSQNSLPCGSSIAASSSPNLLPGYCSLVCLCEEDVPGECLNGCEPCQLYGVELKC